MSVPKDIKQTDVIKNNIDEVKEMLNRYFNGATSLELKVYEDLILKLNKELFDAGKLQESLVNSIHFDVNEMNDYMVTIKNIMDDKKKDPKTKK